MPLSSLLACSAVLLAMLIDWGWGEPPNNWHPVVWMGKYLGWAGKWVAPSSSAESDTKAMGSDYWSFCLGGLAWCVGAAAVFVAVWCVQTAILLLPQALGAQPGGVLAAVFLGLLLKPLLAWAMLKSEVLAVEAALGESLAEGRQRLAWLVSRDVAGLTQTQVRESAIESLAENLNDSVVAPIFWFVLLGLPGAALYRFANTADAMWGYRGERHGRVWEWAGKWAAWADDGLSWLPARITAALLMGVAWCNEWRTLCQQALQTPSPNSGWPMAAMAVALGVRLGKPGVYTLNAVGRAPVAGDTAQAVFYAQKTIFPLILLAFIAIVLITP